MTNLRNRSAKIALAVSLLGATLITTTTTANAGTTTTAAFDSNLPIGDLPGWRQTFTEGFDTPLAEGAFKGSPLEQKFRAYGPSKAPSYTAWTDTSHYGRYMPEIMSVEKGMLTEHVQTKNGYPYVAALVPRLAGTSQNGMTYGRFAVKFRSDFLPGYKIAFMLWPDAGNNKVNGEIDLPELDLDATSVRGFMHMTNQTPGPTQQGWAKSAIDPKVWNVATIEWSPNLVVFILNGVEIGRFTTRVPTAPMHWVMQTEVQLHRTAPPSPAVKGNVQIAWMAAWAYAPNG